MAKVSIRTIPVVYLELSAEEASWLKVYLGDYLGRDESAQDRNIREAIFEALPWQPGLS